MIEGVGSKNSETKSTDNTETKTFAPEKLYQELAKVANKLNDMLFDGDTAEKGDENEETKSEDVKNQSEKETSDKKDVNAADENSSDGTSELLSKSISELMNRLFSNDLGENPEETSEGKEKNSANESDKSDANDSGETESGLKSKDTGTDEGKDSKEVDIEKKDPLIAKIEKTLGTPEGIKALIERHPEKAELWKSQLEALDTLNDPDASPAEIRSAQAKLSILKGQLLETAVKDALADAGFDVESQQRVVEGENGGTRPDVIAKNNTDHPIEAFGVIIQPGDTLSVECKCGGSAYMTNQLNNHIANQLSGQEGTKILLTTSDIMDTPPGLAKGVCDRYGAKLVIADVSVADVEKAIKEVAES